MVLTKKGLKRKAWQLFSVWVRSHNADFQGYSECYTCYRKFLWKEMNAGHYRHDSYDFDERNVKPQCVQCNLRESGRADEFYLHLVREYGVEVADHLRTRPKWNDYTIPELQEIIKKYEKQG